MNGRDTLRASWLASLSALVFLLAAFSAHAQMPPSDARLEQAYRWLNSGHRYTESGDYALAASAFDRAEQILEARPDPYFEGVLMNNRGLLALRQVRPDEARELLEEAIVLFTRTVGPDALDVAVAEQNLASTLSLLGHPEEALRHANRSIEISEARLPPDDLQLAFAYSSRGLILLDGTQDIPAAIEDLEASLAIGRKRLAPEDPTLATPLSNLARAHLRRGSLEDRTEAEALLLEADFIQDAAGVPPGHHARFFVVSGLADLYDTSGRSREALTLWERLYEQARTLHGPAGVDTAIFAGRVGDSYREFGYYEQAEVLLVQALQAQDELIASGNPLAVDTLRYLANWRADRGDSAGALEIRRDIVALHEARGDQTSPNALGDRVGLAWDLIQLGRADQGREILEAAIPSLEAALGERHPRLASAHGALGMAYRWLDLPDSAERHLQRAFEISRDAHGPDSVWLATPLNNLANFWTDHGRFEEAEQAYLEAIRLDSARLGPDAPALGLPFSNLAHLYGMSGRPDEAHRALDEALRRYELAGDAGLSGAWFAHLIRARLYARQGDLESALSAIERSSSLVAAELAAGGEAQLDVLTATAASRREVFDGHLGLLANLDADDPRRLPESFLVIQRARLRRTGRAFDAMRARFASGDGELARDERAHRDLVRRLGDLDERILSTRPEEAADTGAVADPDADPQALATQRRKIAVAVSELERGIRARHPEYEALVRPKPRSLPEVQAELAPDEALVVFGVLPDRTLAWVVRDRSAALVPLAIDADTLGRDVARLRAGLVWNESSATPVRPFDLETAQRLHDALFRPLDPLLEGARILRVVPDGPLESLPLGLLVESAAPASPDRYRKSRWVIDRFALTTAPAVHAISRAASPEADGPSRIALMGFGDPALPETNGAGDLLGRSERETYGHPVPATRAQLLEMAALAGGDEHLYLGARATEGRLKALSTEGALERADTLVLATHAFREPGGGAPYLVLSPPQPEKRDGRDDGRLTAGEIARDLRLDARLVVLSACDSALAQERGGEVFSGLARAFFHAGARSILVSHWPVEANATGRLMGEFGAQAFGEQANGPARALRDAQIQLLGRGWEEWLVYFGLVEDHSHPIYWAPFVVLGDG